MTEDVRAALWRAMQAQGITGPEMFALRYGRRLRDLTPAKALEIITTPAVRHHPSPSFAPPAPRDTRDIETGKGQSP